MAILLLFYYCFSLDWPLVCVYDTVCEHNVPLDHVDDLPGQMYNLTEQCQLFMDPTSSFEPCVSIVFGQNVITVNVYKSQSWLLYLLSNN